VKSHIRNTKHGPVMVAGYDNKRQSKMNVEEKDARLKEKVKKHTVLAKKHHAKSEEHWDLWKKARRSENKKDEEFHLREAQRLGTKAGRHAEYADRAKEAMSKNVRKWDKENSKLPPLPNNIGRTGHYYPKTGKLVYDDKRSWDSPEEHEKKEKREQIAAMKEKNWTSERVARKLVREMGLDVKGEFHPTKEQIKKLSSAIEEMKQNGLVLSKYFVETMSSGDQDEAKTKYGKIKGFKKADKVLNDIFNGD
jgi:hypothetical protein